ncbi:MAG TPA: methyltransferase domain-containing protein [Acidimicrobiales bacterium]|nr:methyltransferase domain-containing protein [Acidimicrobiales bacterium]
MDEGSAEDRLRPRRRQHAYHPLRLLAAALQAEVADTPTPVLDLGCGAKPYDPLLARPSIGLDAQAFHGRPDALALAEHLPVRDASVGTVLSTQQLEHVNDPALVLAEARRVVRPDGRLLLSTHGVWAHHPDPRDLWRWTQEGLEELVTRAGFRVERVHPLGGPVTAGALLATYPLAGAARRGGPQRLVAAAVLWLLNAVLGPIDRVVGRAAPRPYGSVGYLVVASPAAETRTTSPGDR